MKNRNKTTYRATFSQLRLHAFGIENTIDYTGEIEIYQARVSPELWRARPTFRHGDHDWEASSAELLQAKIAADFEYTLKPWHAWVLDPQQIRRPSLAPARHPKCSCGSPARGACIVHSVSQHAGRDSRAG